MHELAICQALIEQVERVARDNAARRILSITVSVGPLSGVEPQLLEHAYPLAAAGTVAEEAKLVPALALLAVLAGTPNPVM